MDAAQFDRVTKTLSRGANRRLVLGALVGTTMASLLLGERTAAKPKRKRRTKRRRPLRAEQSPEGQVCTDFCHTLPPEKERGQCLAGCAQGDPGGLFAQCEGDPARLCPQADGSLICCQAPYTFCHIQIQGGGVCECDPFSCSGGLTPHPVTCACECRADRHQCPSGCVPLNECCNGGQCGFAEACCDPVPGVTNTRSCVSVAAGHTCCSAAGCATGAPCCTGSQVPGIIGGLCCPPDRLTCSPLGTCVEPE